MAKYGKDQLLQRRQTHSFLSETTTMEECEMTTRPHVSNVSTTNRGPELLEILQEEVVSDSDEGGGVQL